MCGIAGYFSSEQSVSKEILEKATTRLAHRGPDAFGYFQEGPVGMGHRRLSIIDLSSSANQPFHDSSGRYVMVYNGEVYNFKEIGETLNKPLKTHSDTEVIIEAFEKWGVEFVHKLNGMFSIAIYDRHSKELYLFRDRLGIKPLFYAYHGGTLFFASETKALLEFGIPRELNIESLKDYLFLEYVPAEKSIFKGIKKMKNGTFLKVDSNGVEHKTYYNILDKFAPNEDCSGDQHAEELEERLERSVNLRKISDVPIGAFLSGGADSSLICALFQKNTSTPIHTFNIGFENPDFDESKYARDVAEALNTKHTMTLGTEKELLALLEDVIEYYDEPFATPSTFPTMLVSAKARENVTVALSGDGGDELFMGYGYYNWRDRVDKINKLGGKAGRRLMAAVLPLIGGRQARAARVLDYGDLKSDWLHIWSQEQYMFNQSEITELFNRKYENETLLSSWESIDRLQASPYEKISLFDIQHYLTDNLLYKVDIASMRHGLEVRVPFLDHNVVEKALQIPQAFKINNGVQKYVEKKILKKYIRPELVDREKWGFPAPVIDWLTGDLKYLLDTTLSKQVVEKQGLFNYKVIHNMVNQFLNGKTYHYKRIWALIFFQVWYKKYLDSSLFEMNRAV